MDRYIEHVFANGQMIQQAQSLAAVESTSVSLVDRLAEVNLFLALFN